MHQIPGGMMVEVTIKPYGFDVCVGQLVIDVRYDPKVDSNHQPRLVLFDGGYLIPTLSV